MLRRLRWSDHPVGSQLAQDRAAMARAFAYLFGLGATLVLATMLISSPPGRFLPGVIGPVIAAYAVVAVMLLRFDRLPHWVFAATPAPGTVLVSLVVLSGGANVVAAYSMFYFWVVLSAFYFFSRKIAALHLTLVAVCLTVVLVLTPKTPDRPLLWRMAMGTLTVAGALVRLLSERMQYLVAQLGEAARTDPLTGLLNRRGLTERADVEFSRARRNLAPLTMMLLDLDHFKAINDECGHEAGDEVLIRVADLLRLSKRGVDAAARMGGEEFALLLTDTDEDQAMVVAERIRRSMQIVFEHDPITLTLSIGISSYPHQGATAPELLRASDDALYAAKLGGRDRSEVAPRV
jgi:diguanylate cyclase (GGDEF)-like protein